MKKFTFLLTALFAVTLSAQTPTIPPGGVGAVTPYPTATPTGLAIGQQGTPRNFHYNVTLAQIKALGAATSGDVTIATLPANSVILDTCIKPFVAVAGTSFSAATARVITANHNFGTAFDVFQAVGNTVFDYDGTHAAQENVTTTTPLLLHMTSTGGNLSAATAGSIDVWVTFYTHG